jgi:hypothetical protein
MSSRCLNQVAYVERRHALPLLSALTNALGYGYHMSRHGFRA